MISVAYLIWIHVRADPQVAASGLVDEVVVHIDPERALVSLVAGVSRASLLVFLCLTPQILRVKRVGRR